MRALWASAGTKEKMDAYVVLVNVRRGDVERNYDITIKSPVSRLYQESLEKTARQMLNDLGITGCVLTIEDNHAIPPVLRARIKAAAQRYVLAFHDDGSNGGSL